MKNGILRPVGRALAGAARMFDEMDIFPMRVTAAAAALSLAMTLSSCVLLLALRCADVSTASVTAYRVASLASGLFDGGMRLLALGFGSAVAADILLRAKNPLL